jgi:hypothetical protein
MQASVVATWYIALAGAPLFCGGVYDTEAIWIALPVEEYEITWSCGDLIAIGFVGEDGYITWLLVRVRDTGPFGKHCVVQMDGSCVSIGADIPWHLWPIEGVLSAPVVVINITAEVKKGRVQ